MTGELVSTKVTTYLIAEDEKPYMWCGTPTEKIEVLSESRFCGDECVNTFYKEVVDKAEMAFLDSEEEV